ncbi:MAG TPA: hypothetical protein VEC39_15255 [Vicinamibacterales bacterium]|nr:hypothetical protein [Vicinamibacterales bacterium]
MKTVIKLVLTLAILVACFNGAMAAFNNYRFEDAVHEGLLFDPRATDEEITDMVVKLGGDYGVPIDVSGVSIRTVGPDLHVDMSYTTTVVLLPGIYSVDWTFTPSTSTRLLGGPRR